MQVGVVGKFVEFFGPGVTELSIADRATISNMCPEYGATVGYFPVDEKTIAYLHQTSEFINSISLYFHELNFSLDDTSFHYQAQLIKMNSELNQLIDEKELILWFVF